MTGRLEGKIALITGGCSGIGLATVRRFLAEGARIVVADIQDTKGVDLENANPGSLVYVRCDIREEAEIEAAIDHAVAEYEGLDVVFHSAGIGARTANDLSELTVEDWDDDHAILLRSGMLLIKHSFPVLKRQGGGSIVLTSSCGALALSDRPSLSAYPIFKAAVIYLGRNAAFLGARDLIRVNTLVPGAVPTPMHLTSKGYDIALADKMAPHLAKQAMFAEYQVMPIVGHPDDMANAVLYLASDESRFVTGTELVVGGGLHLGRRLAAEQVRDDIERAQRLAEAELNVTLDSDSARREENLNDAEKEKGGEFQRATAWLVGRPPSLSSRTDSLYAAWWSWLT